MGLLDIIFPKYCINCKKYQDYLCSDCFSSLSFDTKLTKNGIFIALGTNMISKKLIKSFKEKPNLSDLGGYLADLFYESLIQNEGFNKIFNKDLLLVPIPLEKEIFRKRGYSQSEILANELSKRLKLMVINCLDLNKEGFFIKKKYVGKLVSRNILLIDDVSVSEAELLRIKKAFESENVGEIYACFLINGQ